MTFVIDTNFQTHPKVAEYMAGLLYNLDDDDIHICEPTPGQGNLVSAVYTHPSCRHIDQVHVPAGDYWEMEHKVEKYSAFIMNPPFTPMTEPMRFLEDAMNRTDYIVALVPWLVIINSERRWKKIYEWGMRSVTRLPRKAFPGSRIQCCILVMEKGYAPFPGKDYYATEFLTFNW